MERNNFSNINVRKQTISLLRSICTLFHLTFEVWARCLTSYAVQWCECDEGKECCSHGAGRYGEKSQESIVAGGPLLCRRLEIPLKRNKSRCWRRRWWCDGADDKISLLFMWMGFLEESGLALLSFLPSSSSSVKKIFSRGGYALDFSDSFIWIQIGQSFPAQKERSRHSFSRKWVPFPFFPIRGSSPFLHRLPHILRLLFIGSSKELNYSISWTGLLPSPAPYCLWVSEFGRQE